LYGAARGYFVRSPKCKILRETVNKFEIIALEVSFEVRNHSYGVYRGGSPLFP
jgi:hypothetical protein